MNTEIAARIKAIRTEHGLSQEKFGNILFVSQDTVSLWEKGKSLPTAEYIILICKIYNTSADYILGLTE